VLSDADSKRRSARAKNGAERLDARNADTFARGDRFGVYDAEAVTVFRSERSHRLPVLHRMRASRLPRSR
jgi:hypothetical protein